MAVETKYVCDRCGAVAREAKQMWGVTIYCESFGSGRPNSYSLPRHEQMWCRACAEKLALLPNVQVPPEQVHKNVTLEELVREIAREVVNEEV